MKEYLSTREAAEKWGISERRVNQYCAEERIPGAQRLALHGQSLRQRKSPVTQEKRIIIRKP